MFQSSKKPRIPGLFQVGGGCHDTGPPDAQVSAFDAGEEAAEFEGQSPGTATATTVTWTLSLKQYYSIFREKRLICKKASNISLGE